MNDQHILNVLRHGKTFESQRIYRGVSGVSKVKLKDGISAVAKCDKPSNVKHEVAAYRISKLLGWNIVPPTTLRRYFYHGSDKVELNSFQYFIENANHFDVDNYDDIILPLDVEAQRRRIIVFDSLIRNTDRNYQNALLVNGKVWAIDHAYSFFHDHTLLSDMRSGGRQYLTESTLSDLRDFKNRRSEVVHNLKSLLSGHKINYMFERLDAILNKSLDNDYYD